VPLGIATLNSQAPSLTHPLGTDPFSRDVLSRLIYGTRVSLSIALCAAPSRWRSDSGWCDRGYMGGAIDAILMRIVDAASSIPTLLLLIVVIALWKNIGLLFLTCSSPAVAWFTVSRLVRAETLAVRDADFVVAARALGASSWRILARHVLPNVVGPAHRRGTLAIGNVILLEPGCRISASVCDRTASWGSHSGRLGARARSLVAHAFSGTRHSRHGLCL
jgi:peptide/nickel transport system permease protein